MISSGVPFWHLLVIVACRQQQRVNASSGRRARACERAHQAGAFAGKVLVQVEEVQGWRRRLPAFSGRTMRLAPRARAYLRARDGLA